MKEFAYNNNQDIVALYCRTAGRGTKQEKIQLDLLVQFAEKMGYPYCTTYCDWNKSGLTLDRPKIQELLADVYSGKVKRIIVQNVSQLSRSLLDVINLLSQFDKYDVELISINDVGIVTEESIFGEDDILN